MIKKLVLLFISLFLISPIAFADDSSIVPVLWLFTKNNRIKHEQLSNVFNNNSLAYEFDGSISFSQDYNKAIKSYYLRYDDIIYEFDGSISFSQDCSKAIKSYYLR